MHLSFPLCSLSMTLAPVTFSTSPGIDWSFADRAITDYDLFICYEGRACVRIGDESFPLEAGSGILIPPTRSFSISVERRNCVTVSQHFGLQAFGIADFFSLIEYRRCV